MQLVHPHASWFWDICELGIGATPLSFEESLLYYTSIMMICKHYVVGTLVHLVSCTSGCSSESLYLPFLGDATKPALH